MLLSWQKLKTLILKENEKRKSNRTSLYQSFLASLTRLFLEENGHVKTEFGRRRHCCGGSWRYSVQFQLGFVGNPLARDLCFQSDSCLLKLSMLMAMSFMFTVPSLLTSALGSQFGELGLVLKSIIMYATSFMLHT